MAKLTGPENICKNCETEFIGHYCPNCAQSVRDLDRPFIVMVFDIMANMWAFDTRVFKTFKSLLFRPGEMAHDYAEGKRARYMPPFRLYIFTSIIFFLLLNISMGDQIKSGIDKLSLSEDGKVSNTANNNVVQINAKAGGKTKNFTKIVSENKDYYVSRFFSLLSWSLFILMPLYAFFLWVFFRKRQKYFLAHFISAINQHTFLFLIFIIIITINLIFPAKTISPESYLLVLFPVYVITGSRKLYRTSWLSTFFRISAAQILYLMTILVAIGFIFYFTFSKVFEN
ncbi:MAG: DUF3667 domain-containing protein [Bacteroidales bacterium]|nr:DUF3667 domain-containing protein [Bacteroidales bacterium]